LSVHLAGDRGTIVYQRPGYTPATYAILNFPVDDVDNGVDERAAPGVELERYEGLERDEKGISRRGGLCIACSRTRGECVVRAVGEVAVVPRVRGSDVVVGVRLGVPHEEMSLCLCLFPGWERSLGVIGSRRCSVGVAWASCIAQRICAWGARSR
jgi:hypothetical protein